LKTIRKSFRAFRKIPLSVLERIHYKLYDDIHHAIMPNVQPFIDIIQGIKHEETMTDLKDDYFDGRL